MSVLELQLVSPKLLSARGLSLAVPGTYRVDGSCVKIRKFLPNVQVRFDSMNTSSTTVFNPFMVVDGSTSPRNTVVSN